MNYDGQLLFGGTTLYSPWFPRNGNVLRATAEVIRASGGTLEVRVFTKNREDVGNGINADGTAKIVITTTTVPQSETDEWGSKTTASGLKEMVRYEFKNTSTTDSQWILFRMLSPVWTDFVSIVSGS